MKFKVKIHEAKCLGRFSPKYQAAQKWLDNEVLKDCGPYVPMQTGYLMNSGNSGTVIGSGTVVYNAPYARVNYYGVGRHFSTQKHPQACAQWFEKAKAVKLKSSWEPGVNKIMKG